MREGEGALSDVRLYLSRDNLLINMDRLVSEEGWVASCHLIDQHPQSPPVHRFVVALHVGREGEGRERGAKGEGEGRERGAKGEGEGRERGAKGEGEGRERGAKGEGEGRERGAKGEGEGRERGAKGEGEGRERGAKGEGEGRERGAKGEGEGRERGAKGEGEGRERGAKGEGDKHNTMHLETLQPSDIIYSALYTHLPYISLRVMVLP